jgi:hypothetical protein
MTLWSVLLATIAAVGFALLLAAVFALRAAQRRLMARDERLRRGAPTCARCGYDLSRTPHLRCPECGALRGFRRSANELGIEAGEATFDRES